MRKVTKLITSAFVAGQTACIGNSMTDGTRLYLHGNLIAKRECWAWFYRDEDHCYCSLACYDNQQQFLEAEYNQEDEYL